MFSRKNIFTLALLALMVAAFKTYALFWYIPQQLQNDFTAGFNSIGFKNISFESQNFARGKITFHNITFDNNPDNKIENIVVKYSVLNYFLNGFKAKTVTLENLKISGNLTEDYALEINDTSKFNPIEIFSNFPTQSLIITNAQATINAPQFKKISLDFNANFKYKNENLVYISGTANTQGNALAFSTAFSGSITQEKKLDLNIETKNIFAKTKDYTISNANTSIMVNTYTDRPSSFSFEGDCEKLTWSKLPFAELKFSGEKSEENYNFYTEGKAQNKNNIEFTFNINRVDGITSYSTQITPQIFKNFIEYLKINDVISADFKPPAQLENLTQPILSFDYVDQSAFDKTPEKQKVLAPVKKGNFNVLITEPNIELNGTFQINENNEVSGNLVSQNNKLTFRNQSTGIAPKNLSYIDFDYGFKFNLSDPEKNKKTMDWNFLMKATDGILNYGFIELQNITGNIFFSPVSKNKRFEELSFKLPLQSLVSHEGRIFLDFIKSPFIREIDLFIFGGKIRTQEFDLVNGEIPDDVNLVLSDIGLSHLTHALNYEGFRAEGKIGGLLPLKIKDNKIKVKGGIIQSQGLGIIQIPHEISESYFPGPLPSMQKKREALENFYYEFFEVRLDGNINGAVMMTINASGYNPKMQDKDQIDIDLQIEIDMSQFLVPLLDLKP